MTSNEDERVEWFLLKGNKKIFNQSARVVIKFGRRQVGNTLYYS
jgi:hypothetical protein